MTVSPTFDDGIALASDAELLRRVAEGDRDALRGVFDRFKGSVFGIAFACLQDRAAALEVVEQVMVAIRKGAATTGGPATVRVRVLQLAIDRIRALERLRDQC